MDHYASATAAGVPAWGAPEQDPIEDKPRKIKEKRSVFALLLDCELAIVAALVLAFIVPQLFGYVPDVVMSASMEPTVPMGAVAFIDENVGASELRSGDIAVYKPVEGTQVLHRVQHVSGEAFTFKGDANKENDAGEVSSSQIVGRYMFDIPELGYAYVFFDNNRVAIIVIVLVANLAVWLLSERQRKRHEREAEEERARTERTVEDMVRERLDAAIGAQVPYPQNISAPAQQHRPNAAYQQPTYGTYGGYTQQATYQMDAYTTDPNIYLG